MENLKALTSVGSRIRDLRERHGYTQDDIAEKLGVSRVAVTQWEKDTNRPKKLYELAQLLGTTVNYLETGNSEKATSHQFNKPEVSKGDQIFLKRYHSLSATRKATLNAILRDMEKAQQKESSSLSPNEILKKEDEYNEMG